MRARAALRALSRRGLSWPVGVVVAVSVIAPWLGTAMELKWTLWLSFAILALSLDLLWGIAGIFSFGQNAFFGVGAYGYAVAALNFFPATHETLSALAIGAGTAAGLAAVVGYVTFYGRVGDVYLAIVTLSVTLILYVVMSSTAGPEYAIGVAQLGGFNGMPSVPGIALGDGELSTRQQFVFAVVLAGSLFALAGFVATGRRGRVLAGIRENEQRMELLGYDVRRHKLAVFVMAGFVAGLGGGLFAAWGTFVNPAVFSLTQAAMVAIWVMVGGRGTLLGAVVGVAVVQWTADQADRIVAQQTPLVLGVVMVLVVLAFPGGLVPAVRSGWARLSARRAPIGEPAQRHPLPPAPMPAHAMTRPARPARTGSLGARGLVKRFDGVMVLRDVDLEFGEHPIHAVIGPNGAGKSTLFGLLTGRLDPDAGRVDLNGKDVTRLAPFRRARLGLGIKMQVTSIFPGLTVAENIALALMATGGSAPRNRIDRILTRVALIDQRDETASRLSHGRQQWLEIGMVLAQDATVMLLDEPVAGMSDTERAATVDLIRDLATDHTIVVVEHDMRFIRALAAPVAMLHRGEVFRQGSFDELNADASVRAVYLGRRDVAAHT